MRRIRPTLVAVLIAAFAAWTADASTAKPPPSKYVALTFDDGPGPLTREFMAYLKKRKVPGTFFVLGQHARRDPKLLRQMVDEGHEVANHSFNHPSLTRLSDAAVRNQLSRTNRVIRKATGKKPLLMRPPGGAVNGRVRSIARSLGLKTVIWDVDPFDWQRPGTSTIVRRVLSQAAHNGVKHDIVLMHDFGGPRQQTLSALPRIISTLRKRGYTFVTTSELLKLRK